MQSIFEKSGAFVASHFTGSAVNPQKDRNKFTGPAITISHQTGAGAHPVAEQLTRILQSADGEKARQWTVFDRSIVETALEEHHLPQKLAKKMPEDKRSYVDDILDDLFGLRPPSWVLVPQVVETILRLAEAGHVIIIGRGATIATAQLPNVFHVRLMASLSTRISRTQVDQKLTTEEAIKFVEKEDRGRERYIRSNFHARLDDESLYDMVLNTDRISLEDAAALIAEGAVRYFRSAAAQQDFPSERAHA